MARQFFIRRVLWFLNEAPFELGIRKRDVCFRIPIAANSIESILCEAIKLEYSAFSSLGVNQSSRELNDAERAKLNELIVANKALLAPLDDDITNLVGDECKFKVLLLNLYVRYIHGEAITITTLNVFEK